MFQISSRTRCLLCKIAGTLILINVLPVLVAAMDFALSSSASQVLTTYLFVLGVIVALVIAGKAIELGFFLVNQ